MSEMVKYSSEAYRSSNRGRPNYFGCISAWTLKFFGRYMAKHQVMADGTLRDAHNWKQGMPPDRYAESLSRHYVELSEVWDRIFLYDERTDENIAALEEAMGGVMFNICGLIHEWERGKEAKPQPQEASGRVELIGEAPLSSAELPSVLRQSDNPSTPPSEPLQ